MSGASVGFVVRRPIAILVAVLVMTGSLLAAAGCSGSPEPTGATGSTVPPRSMIVASTPLVGALVRAVVGDQADVRVLLDAAADPRTGAVADRASALDGADLVVFVDPGFETAVAPIVDTAIGDGVAVLALAPALNPVPLGGSEVAPGTTAAATGATDPHVWLDPDRWTQAARLVADEVVDLPGIDPTVVQANVAAFDDAASRADETIQAALGAVPDGRRVLVSDLPALAYVADRYGFDLVLADGPEALVAAAAAHGAGVVFTSAARRDELAAVLAVDAPALVVVGLDLDRPATASGPAAYTELIVGAADQIAAALRA